MTPLNFEAELRQLLNTRLPAVNTAGCHFSPVQGLTGESWRIDGEGISMLARQQTAEKGALGVSRKREARLLRRCGTGLGPQVLAQSNHWIIVEWLTGKSVTNEGFDALNQCGELAAMAAGLHRRPLSGYRLNLQRQFVSYWQQLDKRRLTPAWLRCQQHFLRITPPTPLQLAPIHMDIHPGNLITSAAGLRLIDWEYAADGDVALDIAALFRSNDWASVQQQCFLQHYAQHGYPDEARLHAQVQCWLPWVDYLMLMWFEARWQQSGDAEFLHWGAVLRQRFC
ncbi:phosphotransferase [Serratia symbiotica]|uniref:Thiamine kinase n=1 Tax=Serratia symbiotica SCt-VLC TaxID=1347341 RepID=A0A068R9V7_9GAMM|nr:phosphotransferase [Serratia symbiotica]CDG47476.1 Thiamine kinase [Serratia symbiotica SCt-VLC]